MSPLRVSPTHFKPLSPLTDIEEVDPETDQGLWLQKLDGLAAKPGLITVMHLHDIRFPFQDDAALDVALQLVKHTQPDVIVVGSDAGDFSLLGSFDKDPSINEAYLNRRWFDSNPLLLSVS